MTKAEKRQLAEKIHDIGDLVLRTPVDCGAKRRALELIDKLLDDLECKAKTCKRCAEMAD